MPPRQTTGSWPDWLTTHFAAYTAAPMAARHIRLWDWLEALTPGVRPRPRVEIWPRGGGKSSSVELGCARVGAKLSRRYVLYVSETQAQANRHVQAIATMLEQLGIGRASNEYGSSQGWRREELRTASGFNVTAFGLDSAMRGVKLDQFRPDLIVMDDIDARHDTEAARQKKIEAITTSILPAGSADCAVLVLQNRIYRESIVSQLADGTADFLHDRLPAAEEPAVLGLDVARELTPDGAHYRITAGTPTWAGQDLATCERQLNAWGLSAFMREVQHDVDEVDGGLWDGPTDIEPFRVTRPPELVRVAVALDPSATATGDEAGIIAGGIDARGHGYLLDDCSLRGPPKAWAEAAVAAYWRHRASALVAESNQGGEMITATIRTVPDAPAVTLVHASQGKLTRAEPVQKLAADGRLHHVGTFWQLERELRSWRPGLPSPNRLDAYVALWTFLLLGKRLPRWRALGD